MVSDGTEAVVSTKKRMPSIGERLLSEPGAMLVKAYFYGWHYVMRIVQQLTGRAARRKIRFTPHVPTRAYLQWKLVSIAGIRPELARGEHGGVVMYFLDGTTPPKDAPEPPAGTLNAGARDISKSRVERVFEDVFGYALRVDPTVYEGPMVSKNETNAARDGRVLQGPIERAEPGQVYQVAIDNRCSEDMVEDLRATVVGGQLVLVYRKRRPLKDRFLNYNLDVEMLAPEDAFSADEIGKILGFARAFGLDLGEMDVLRDRLSGRIYIVDVATTPHSPPEFLMGRRGIRAMKIVAKAFREEFLDQRST